MTARRVPPVSDPPVPGEEFRRAAIDTTLARQPGADGQVIALSIALTRLVAEHQNISEARIHRAKGWTYSGFRVLYMIWLLQPVEARDLARLAGVSRQTTSTVLATLEGAKLITRKRSKTDRRLVRVRLTAQGQDLIEAAIAEQNALESDWFGALTSRERDQLLELLDRVIRRMGRATDE